MSGYMLLLCFAIEAGLIYVSFKIATSLPRHFRHKQWLPFSGKALASLCLIPLTCFGLFGVVLESFTYYPRRAFDETAWQDVEKRYRLADDLNDKAKGWDRKHVLEKLGPPEDGQDTDSFTYPTGDPPQILGGADPFVIVVEFQNGKVTRCYVRET
jgi:hypothetical protein